MTWYKHYNDEAITHFNQHGVALNQAATYWEDYGDDTLPRPTISPVALVPGTEYIAVIGLFHLSGAENRGNHHLYIDLIDEDGHRIYDPALLLRWGWEGMTPEQIRTTAPVRIDKPFQEPGANIGLYWGQVVFGFALDDWQVDRISKIHIRYGNDKEGNHQGHHSHYAVLQRRVYAGQPPDLPDLPDRPDPFPLLLEVKGTIRIVVDKDYFNSLPADDQGRVDLIVPIYTRSLE